MLSENDLLFINELSDSSIGNAELLHLAGVKAIAKAYATGSGEFGQACCNAVRISERLELAKFMKKHGLNVIIDKTKVVIQGPLDRKRADKDIREAKNDIAFFKITDAHIKTQKTNKMQEKTIAEQAELAIRNFIKRIKNDDVRAIVNERLQKPNWVEKLSKLNINEEEEIDIIINTIIKHRLTKKTN